MIKIMLATWEWNLVSISFVALVCVFVAVFIFSISFHYFSQYIDRRHNSNIAFNSEKSRIFTLDVSTSQLYYFDKQDMRNQVKISFDDFYSEFDKLQAEQMHQWINSSMEENSHQSAFISFPSKIKTTGKECILLFHITSYNREKHKLHFEEITLPGVSIKKNCSAGKNYLKSVKQIQNIIETNKKYRQQCLLIYIKLNHKTGKINENSNTESYTYYSIYQPLVSTYRYLNKSRFLAHIDDRKACLFDFDITDEKIEVLCRKIIRKFERYFQLKAIPTLYTISIGCARIKDFSEPLSKTIKRASKMADRASELEGDSNYLIEGELTSWQKAKNKRVKTEVIDMESLIANRTFRCYFTPVLSTDIKKNTFLATIKPYGTSIKEYNDLAKEAKHQGKLRKLLQASFTTIYQSIGKNDYDFIFFTSFNNVPSVVSALEGLAEIKSKLYLLLNLSEIQQLSESGLDVDKYLEALKQAGIKIALNYDDVDLDAPKGILARCSMFLIVVNSEGLHSDERTKSELIAFKAVLQDYNKPIIVDKMLTSADILFAKDLGYNSFICESVAGTSSSPYILEDDWKEEIKKIDEVSSTQKDEKELHEEVVKEEE